MSKMGQYVFEIQEAVQDAVFQAAALQMSQSAVVEFVKKRVPHASTSDILSEYLKFNGPTDEGP